ncbi:MAG: enoyl-CoA hydratase/isomerase family protein [Thermodesulfobacteriota bacterium]|nr:enoyl-CoA hydratase/isomerase family protein [Thermodesulfobacteriota bacterium]
MDYKTILVEKKDKIGVITLNCPKKLNAIGVEMKRELYEALCDLEADDDVQVIIYTGTGRAFSSGHDNSDPPEAMDEFTSLKQENKLFSLDKPIIAAIHGYTLGDGMQQALLCDIIVASENSQCGFIGALIGAFCYGTFTILPQVVGRQKANELLFTCDRISAEEALKIGLVNKVVPHEELMPAAIEMAEKIMRCPPLSIKHTKRGLRTALINEEHKKAVDEGWGELLIQMAELA